ncbi:MAG: glycosyltransferase family 2 protein [Bacteroidales bacterium]|nr:glycosyltransferase family 2 protein [Bacteroidales bacterium]
MLSISIVTYNTSTDELAKCLSSLASPIVKIIYIVDNSNQQYLSDFCKGYDNVIYIGSENVGYGAGHNKALRKALEDKDLTYHLVLNSDVYFEPSILEKIANYMDSNEDVAQIQPYVTFPNGELQYTVRLLPTPANLIFRRFMPKSIVKKMDTRYTLAFWNHKTSANIAYHQGSFMFFRLSAFEKVGLFDERYFMYPEDIDITRRMHQYFKTLYWPEVSIVHAHRAASYKSKKMLKIHIVNMIKYFNKWGWIFDSERQQVNKEILDALGYNNKTNSSPMI